MTQTLTPEGWEHVRALRAELHAKLGSGLPGQSTDVSASEAWQKLMDGRRVALLKTVQRLSGLEKEERKLLERLVLDMTASALAKDRGEAEAFYEALDQALDMVGRILDQKEHLQGQVVVLNGVLQRAQDSVAAKEEKLQEFAKFGQPTELQAKLFAGETALQTIKARDQEIVRFKKEFEEYKKGVASSIEFFKEEFEKSGRLSKKVS